MSHGQTARIFVVLLNHLTSKNVYNFTQVDVDEEDPTF